MLWGVSWMGLGLVLTYATFPVAPQGTYAAWVLLVPGTLFLFLGLLLFLLGLGEMLLSRQPGIRRAKRPKTETDTQIYGFDEDEVRGAEIELRRLGGQLRGSTDIYWVVANRKLLEARKTSDWSAMKSIYNELARRLYEGDKQHFEVAEAAQACELRTFAPFGVEQVEISTGGEGSCAQCGSLQGRRLSVSEAMDEMPLPVRNCSNQVKQRGDYGWCRCSYVAVMDT